ncbi:hypothetical protein [Nocardia brasiliensis]|uniref:hypothetical protein n=1 Tax=Nocardia brasiliensis TaxID=37326 RepID=UPI00366BEBB0
MPIADLVARAFILGGLAWCVFVTLAILARHMRGTTALEDLCPERDGEGCPCCSHTGLADAVEDTGAAWDRARDRDLDYRAGVA